MCCIVPDAGTFTARPFWETFGSRGIRSCIIDVPLVLGRPQAFNGVYLNGWATHDTAATHSWPAPLARQLRRKFGAPAMPAENFGAQTVRSLEQLCGELLRATEQLQHVGASLLRRDEWDFACVVFGPAHRAGHYLWDCGEARDIESANIERGSGSRKRSSRFMPRSITRCRICWQSATMRWSSFFPCMAWDQTPAGASWCPTFSIRGEQRFHSNPCAKVRCTAYGAHWSRACGRSCSMCRRRLLHASCRSGRRACSTGHAPRIFRCQWISRLPAREPARPRARWHRRSGACVRCALYRAGDVLPLAARRGHGNADRCGHPENLRKYAACGKHRDGQPDLIVRWRDIRSRDARRLASSLLPAFECACRVICHRGVRATTCRSDGSLREDLASPRARGWPCTTSWTWRPRCANTSGSRQILGCMADRCHSTERGPEC